VINTGGVEADRIARFMDPDSPFELDPIKGESYKFFGHKRTDIMLHGMNVYPTPKSVETPHGRHFTVGVHLTPTFKDTSYPPSIGSTITIGPRLTPVNDRDSWQGEVFSPEMFVKEVAAFFPGLRTEDLLWHQDGLQARLKGYSDFMIHSDPRNPNMISLLGIDSPGLTSCLAIASRVRETLNDLDI
jgi:L-2-hydroxyglutarate oxidase LhgO